MGIGIITNFEINTSKNIDDRLGPYATLAEVTTAIPLLFRYVGLTVTVTGSGAPVEYWFNPTTADADLVLKAAGEYTFNSSASAASTSTLFTVEPAAYKSVSMEYYLILDLADDYPSRSGKVVITIPTNYATEQIYFTEQATVQNSTLASKTTPGTNTALQYFTVTYAPTTVTCALVNDGDNEARIRGRYKLIPKLI